MEVIVEIPAKTETENPPETVVEVVKEKTTRKNNFVSHLQKKGPKAPGSKPVPQGAPNCLRVYY